MNNQEIGQKRVLLCLLLGLPYKYESNLVYLTKDNTWQTQPVSRSPTDFSGTAQLNLLSWAGADVCGAAQKRWEIGGKKMWWKLSDA